MHVYVARKCQNSTVIVADGPCSCEYNAVCVCRSALYKLVFALLAAAVQATETPASTYNRTASVGSSATFQCPASAGDWYFTPHLSPVSTADQQQRPKQLTTDGQVVNGLEDKYVLKYRVDESETRQQRLQVLNVQTEDVGLYRCVRTHTAFRLEVPCFTQTICEGQHIWLQCQSTSPGTSVVWRYSKTIADRKDVLFSMGKFFVKDRHRMHIHSAAASDGHYSLIIHNTTVDDSGFYGCTENGGFGPGDVCTILTVQPYSNCSGRQQSGIDNRQLDGSDQQRPTPPVNGEALYSSIAETHHRRGFFVNVVAAIFFVFIRTFLSSNLYV